MATFIRGKSGLLEELEQRRARIARPGINRKLTQRARLVEEGQIGVLNELIGWLSLSDVHLLAEQEFDRHPALGGKADTSKETN